MTKRAFLSFVLVFVAACVFAQQKVILINQLGYLPQSVKVAVFLSTGEGNTQQFQVFDALNDNLVYEAEVKQVEGTDWGMKTAFRLDFSALTNPGGYYIKLGETRSPAFQIASDVYEGTADFLLNYMRQQRCGYNPYLQDSCHLHDGIIVDHPTKTGQKIDVTGGWHDASDYLQYLTTSANATYQLLYAYEQNPAVFKDEYRKNGESGANGIPDILDEAKWGLDWMVKMNPSAGEMYNQIADDRDHRGYRLPNKDTVRYGLEGTYRPVYFITGKPQGLAEHKNRTTGVSSSAAKYASSFALGAMMMKDHYPEFAKQIAAKATEAYTFALSDLGACQTACNVSPYFYEEANYVDDLELAATTLYQLTGDAYYLTEAKKWGSVENVTPWMSAGFARHYQFYPFVNLGHVKLAEKDENFATYLKQGLTHLYERGKDDPFLNDIPFIWCSNNLVAAAITQARAYEEITGDRSFAEMEAALRDWLFGCNPWGSSMICGLPAGGDNPQMPHSSITKILGETTYGGLVDGPVYNSIFSGLIGIEIQQPDPFDAFNRGKAVYHDDLGDYSSNEPTMDGTASLSYYLSSMEKMGATQQNAYEKDTQGAIRRIQPSEKTIYLVFSAHDKAEGATHILKVLDKKDGKASFFFTGDFLRDNQFQPIIKKVIKDGHYLGAHSDKHLLYCDWTKRDSLLVDRTTFEQDLKENCKALQQYDINSKNANWFLPPYEWYNSATVNWASAMGLRTINFSPGIRSNADYTTPDMANYMSSDKIFKSILQVEEEQSLNGAIMLIHPGTEEKRTDKFYLRLEELIETLQAKGYRFERLP
ncbi:glycoside hydrolase family 9 protein [Draconibacterium sediminis]|uniref:glycoside hydrolase family 9 protein n=1 Tax=Draconibacterium sediminis TaxID=1544798 RepID=UPI000697EE21|nr:glycoside hydrolase family 9 protein [Draconibacterium sediminis]